MVRNLRKPLIIMTPKSLLRAKDAASPLSEFTSGGFQTVIPEKGEIEADKVKRVVACSGKVYYDLVRKREDRGSDDVAIIRVEQLYPFPHKAFSPSCASIPMRPRSSGARTSRRTRAPGSSCSTTSTRTCRRASGSGIRGARHRRHRRWVTPHLHQKQQKALVDGAFAKLKGFVLAK